MEILIDMFGATYSYSFSFWWCCLKHCLISDCILNKGMCFPYTDISMSRHTFKSMHCLWVLKDWSDEMHMENSTHFEEIYLWFNGVSNQSNNRVSIVRSWITISCPISFFPLRWQILTGSSLKTDIFSVRPTCEKSQKLYCINPT